MKSAVIKRSIVIDGHKTSISVEDSFWFALKEMAHASGKTLSTQIASINADRAAGSNLSSAIRVYILCKLRERVALQLRGVSPGVAVGGP